MSRTEFDSVEVDNEVIIHSEKKLHTGDFVNVKITNAFDYDLEGEVVTERINLLLFNKYPILLWQTHQPMHLIVHKKVYYCHHQLQS